ncbi:MAG: proline racemase family protein [Pseudomonadota bacterium]
MRSRRAIHVIAAHAEGEVGRVITGGVLPPPGKTVLEQRNWLVDHDELRKLLIREPRGGVFTHYNLIVPPCHSKADAGFIIMEPTDYPPMSGSNSICVATVLLETGMVEMTEPTTRMTLETPGGLIEVEADCRDGRCRAITTRNVPCFVVALDVPVTVPDVGSVHVDIAYGGAFFAMVRAIDLDLSLTADRARDLVVIGEKIKHAVAEAYPVQHPQSESISDVTFLTWLEDPIERDGQLTAKNATVISPGKLDRSPCGTASSARAAIMHARGELDIDQAFISRSILDTEFTIRLTGTSEIGENIAVIPSITGRAWITGDHTYLLDPDDPFPHGYALGDTWHRVV